MNLGDAITTALEFETKVRNVYRDAVSKAQDPVAKRVFGALEKEEQEHLEYLANRLSEWKKDGKVAVARLDTSVPTRPQIASEVKKIEGKLATKAPGQASDVEVDMLKRAFELEVETANFYKKMVSELSGEGQALFARFVEIEEGHQAIVQAEIDSVTGMGFWFDFQEFDMSG